MKTNTLLLSFTLGFILFSPISCKSQVNSSDEQVLSMLKRFYRNYITENSKMPRNFSKIDSLKVKYCTSKLLCKIKDEELDYDPFLKAQDSDAEWLKTLTIKKDVSVNNQYYVSYKDTYNATQTVIKLIIVKEKESYKINSIF